MSTLVERRLAARITTRLGKLLKLNNEQSKQVYDVIVAALRGLTK